MAYSGNKLKQLLAEGKPAFGTCICSFSPNLVEVAGFSGFDFCRIDNEHAWRQDSMLEHMLRAAIIADIVPLVRIDKDNPYLIRKVLEIGAGGIIVPEIKDVAEVERVVAAAKFPPKGHRGFSTLCFSAHYGISPASDWLTWSNDETLVGVMIEKPEAVEQVDAIMSVEGLDFVLFGPADYSVAIGLPGPDKNHPRVQEAIQCTTGAAAKHGKAVMIGVSSPWEEESAKYLDMGCRMIEIGHDYSVLAWAWQNALAQAKGK